MTQPSPKAVHAIAAAAGVPVDAEVATRIANSIARHLRALKTEPASFSLIEVAQAIAQKRLSSREP
jgi:hypothetical protein